MDARLVGRRDHDGAVTGTVSLYLSVPAALGAAASFGLTGSLQSRVTKEVPQHRALSPALLVDLARKPRWLLSVVFTIVGVVLQVLALATGPLIVVQALLVLDVPFAVVFAAGLAHRRPDRVFLIGALACMAGLALFLLLARPGGGNSRLTPGEVLPLAIGLAAVLVIALSVAARRSGAPRVLALAVATGVAFGVTAGLMKVLTSQVQRGWSVPLAHWTLYAVCVVGPIGFLLSQNTYQAGRFIAPALAVITVLDPLVGIGIGVLWLGETLHSGTVTVIGEVVALGGVVAGIVVLARRAPQVSPVTAEAPPRVRTT